MTTAQWVVNAYALTFGVLIVTGGRLADLFGRRRAFFVGSAIFAMFSRRRRRPERGLADRARVLMGIGGALMWPAILGMTYAALPAGARRASPAASSSAPPAIGNAAGPLIGGILTDALSWRWIFFLNLPVTAFAALRHLALDPPAARRESTTPRSTTRGIVTVSIGLVALLLAFDQVLDWGGWGDPRIIGLIFLSVLLLASFAFVERRVGPPRPGARAT